MDVRIKETKAKFPEDDLQAVSMSRAILAFRVQWCSAESTDQAQREASHFRQSHTGQWPEQGTSTERDEGQPRPPAAA